MVGGWGGGNLAATQEEIVNQTHVEEFFATARERYKIKRQRDAGAPAPWTKDEALRDWRFCNVFREDDRTTVWVRENVREPLREDTRVFVAMVACRFFNRIETLQVLKDNGVFENWDAAHAYSLLRDVSPIVGAGYLVKTPDGQKKLSGVLTIIEKAREHEAVFTAKHWVSLEDFWKKLRELPFFGSFMAYEVVSDLRHTYLLQAAADKLSWAVPGPGACRGLSWLVGGNMDCVPYTLAAARYESNLRLMRQLLDRSQDNRFWPKSWPQWEMREVEHWLCEYAKWVKVTRLGMRMKRRYP